MTEQVHEDGAPKTPETDLPSTLAGVALEIAANLDKANPEEAEMVRALAKRLFDAAQLPATVEAHPAAAPLRHEVKRTTPIARVGSRAMLMPRDMAEAVEIAKLMATAHGMVGLHLLNNPGGCLGVVLQAMNWGFSPFAVASKTYVAAKEEDLKNPNKPLPPISYEAQLVHAVILSLAPTEQRPEITFEGEGGDMRCIIIATFKGASQPSVLRSEPLSKLKNPKGSPLWEKKPQQQLAYNAVRDWARRYCPDVILGVYTPDEMADFHIEARPHVDDPFAGEGPRQLTVGSSPMATTGASSPELVPVSSSKDST